MVCSNKINISITIIVTLLLLLFSSSVQTATETNDKQLAIDNIVQAYEDVYGFSGTIKVVSNTTSIIEKSYGKADRAENTLNTPEHRFSINSISKTFTALAILLLVDDGKLSLDKPLEMYLPKITSDWASTVTIEHLVTHTSGLPRESGIQPEDNLTFNQQIDKYVAHQQLLFAPGERHAYSNSGYILLGAVIEHMSGMSYSEFIYSRIIKPLKLHNTGVYRGLNVVENQAVPYKFTADGITEVQRSKTIGDSAGGGMYSTVSDLYDYMISVVNNDLLSSELRQLPFSKLVKSGNSYQGFGWTIQQFGTEDIYFASGSGYGTKSVVTYSPSTQDAILITSNWGNTPILQMLRDTFMMMRDVEVSLPTKDNLASIDKFSSWLGLFEFNQTELTKHLGLNQSVMKIHTFNEVLFLDDELLAVKSDKKLGLTYTDELTISLNGDKLSIVINDNELIGKRLKTKLETNSE